MDIWKTGNLQTYPQAGEEEISAPKNINDKFRENYNLERAFLWWHFAFAITEQTALPEASPLPDHYNARVPPGAPLSMARPATLKIYLEDISASPAAILQPCIHCEASFCLSDYLCAAKRPFCRLHVSSWNTSVFLESYQRPSLSPWSQSQRSVWPYPGPFVSLNLRSIDTGIPIASSHGAVLDQAADATRFPEKE